MQFNIADTEQLLCQKYNRRATDVSDYSEIKQTHCFKEEVGQWWLQSDTWYLAEEVKKMRNCRKISNDPRCLCFVDAFSITACGLPVKHFKCEARTAGCPICISNNLIQLWHCVNRNSEADINEMKLRWITCCIVPVSPSYLGTVSIRCIYGGFCH